MSEREVCMRDRQFVMQVAVLVVVSLNLILRIVEMFV